MNTITGRDVDIIALQEFAMVMDDFHFDMSDEKEKMSVAYGDKAKKWIKRIKKIDPFWDENLFISNLLIQSLQKAVSDNEKEIEKEKEKENTIEQRSDNRSEE